MSSGYQFCARRAALVLASALLVLVRTSSPCYADAFICTSSNFNGNAIPAGRTIWFSSVLHVSGLGTQPVTITVQGGTIEMPGGTINVPDASITFDPSATTASTSFGGGGWVTVVPSSGLAGSTFLAGVALPVMANISGGQNPVTWCAQFSSDTPGVSVDWKWAAAVYTSFDPDYNQLGVKPVDDNKAGPYHNADRAGTPENYKSFVTGGARGGGASNYTGSYSGTATVRF
jgi:hypothetical protein